MAAKVISLVDRYYNEDGDLNLAKRYGGMQIVIYSQEALEAVEAYITAQAQKEWEDLEDCDEYNDLNEAIANNANGWAKLTICYDSNHVTSNSKTQGFVSFDYQLADDILDLLLEQYGRPCIEASSINCLGFDRRGKGKTNKHWGVWCNEILVDSNGEVIEHIQP